MVKMQQLVVLGCVVISVLCFSTLSYAQATLPHNDLQPDPDLSAQALAAMNAQFSALQTQLGAMLPNFESDEQAAIQDVIAKIDDKLARIASVNVYFPSDEFETVFQAYQNALDNCLMLSNAEIESAVDQGVALGFIFPAQTLETLAQALSDGKVKAATCVAGKARITVSTVYVNPETNAVIEKTTIVVATDQ